MMKRKIVVFLLIGITALSACGKKSTGAPPAVVVNDQEPETPEAQPDTQADSVEDYSFTTHGVDGVPFDQVEWDALGDATQTIKFGIKNDSLYFFGSGNMPDLTREDKPDWNIDGVVITTVIFDEGISSIGNYNFFGMRIKDVILPESITAIGAHAFEETALTKANLPDSIQTLGDYSFAGCPALNEVIIREGLKTVGEYAFLDDTGVKEIPLPSTLTEIGKGAFKRSGIETAIVPDEITTIEEESYANCINLNEVTLPVSVTLIKEKAFYWDDTQGENPLENIYYTGEPEDWERITIEPGNQILTGAEWDEEYIGSEKETEKEIPADFEEKESFTPDDEDKKIEEKLKNT